MVETSSRVPSRPASLSWHTHKESANQTLALDVCECQRGRPSRTSSITRPPQTRSTTVAATPFGVGEITNVAVLEPASRSRRRRSAGSMSTPRFLISRTPI